MMFGDFRVHRNICHSNCEFSDDSKIKFCTINSHKTKKGIMHPQPLHRVKRAIFSSWQIDESYFSLFRHVRKTQWAQSLWSVGFSSVIVFRLQNRSAQRHTVNTEQECLTILPVNFAKLLVFSEKWFLFYKSSDFPWISNTTQLLGQKHRHSVST